MVDPNVVSAPIMDTARSRLIRIVPLNYNTYSELRNGNIIATTEGLAINYKDEPDKKFFAGYLGAVNKLEHFCVVSPVFKGSILDLDNSRVQRYHSMTQEQKRYLNDLLNEGGISR